MNYISGDVSHRQKHKSMLYFYRENGRVTFAVNDRISAKAQPRLAGIGFIHATHVESVALLRREAFKE
ncbi:MAG: hypothetical protein Q4C72_05100 [Eubacteriales bacterium]|nr:hypothetical protein [Eubacteriales bacterium]